MVRHSCSTRCHGCDSHTVWRPPHGSSSFRARLGPRRHPRPLPAPPQVPSLTAAAARETDLIEGMCARNLASSMSTSSEATNPRPRSRSFVVADPTGLTVLAACQLTRALHRSGRRTLSLWGQTSHNLFETWSEPRRTACWNCCRVRFSDVPAPAGEPSSEQDAALVRALAENVVVAVCHPDLVPYGGTLAEDDENATLHGVVPLPWCSVCGGAAELRHACLLRVVSGLGGTR